MREYEKFSDRFGFSVIPLNGKRPFEKDWTKWAHERRPFKEIEFDGRNAGVVLPAGVVVVDVDYPDRFEQVCLERGWQLPETLTVRTGSHKHHYYFRVEEGAVLKPANLNASYGFELRTVGQLMVIPDSVHPETGEKYVIEKEVAIAPAPCWVKDLLKRDEGGHEVDTVMASDQYLCELNIPAKIRRMVKADPPKGSRSEKLFSVLCSLANAGYGVDTMEYILRRYPIGAKAREKGDLWMRSEIDRAMAKSKDQASVTKTNSFRAAEAASRFLSIMSGKNAETEWLLGGLIPAGEYGYLVAPGSTGKGLFALKLSYSLASGNNLFPGLSLGGSGKVLYCSYEDNTPTIYQRIASLTPGRHLLDVAKESRETRAREVFQKASGGNWYVEGDGHNKELLGHLLQSPTEQDEELKCLQNNLQCFGAELMSRLLVTRSSHGFKPSKAFDDLLEYASSFDDVRLIVIDTLAQAAGETEASNAEASVFNSCMQKLLQATGATILVSAHTTKEASKHKNYMNALADHSQRGPSAFYSAARFQLTMVPMQSGEDFATDEDNEHTSYVAMKSTKCNYPDHLKGVLVFRKHSEAGKECFDLASRDQTSSELADWIVDKVIEEQLTQREFLRTYGTRSGNPFGIVGQEFAACLERCIDTGRVVSEPHARSGYRLSPPSEDAGRSRRER